MWRSCSINHAQSQHGYIAPTPSCCLIPHPWSSPPYQQCPSCQQHRHSTAQTLCCTGCWLCVSRNTHREDAGSHWKHLSYHECHRPWKVIYQKGFFRHHVLSQDPTKITKSPPLQVDHCHALATHRVSWCQLLPAPEVLFCGNTITDRARSAHR